MRIVGYLLPRYGVALILTAGLAAAEGELDRARNLYNRTQYDAALQQLQPLAATRDPAVHELTGKAYFMKGDFKRAAEAFEQAAQLVPGESRYFHWLGKAYGRRAETSSPFTAPAWASKARQNFEKAVALDPRNLEAVNDLFSYYLEAPGFLGGGVDKAVALSRQIEAADPVEYHYALAKIAEKRKDDKGAEQHFRRAMELAPRQVGRVLDLARFLSQRGRHQESESLFAQAEKIAPNEPVVLFDRAAAYIRSRQNLDTARALLQRYLRSPLKPDDPPRSEAEKLLKQAGV